MTVDTKKLEHPPAGLPANLSGLSSKSSYGNSAVSKKARREGKYGPRY
jgi:hypothetical protein